MDASPKRKGPPEKAIKGACESAARCACKNSVWPKNSFPNSCMAALRMGAVIIPSIFLSFAKVTVVCRAAARICSAAGVAIPGSGKGGSSSDLKRQCIGAYIVGPVETRLHSCRFSEQRAASRLRYRRQQPDFANPIEACFGQARADAGRASRRE